MCIHAVTFFGMLWRVLHMNIITIRLLYIIVMIHFSGCWAAWFSTLSMGTRSFFLFQFWSFSSNDKNWNSNSFQWSYLAQLLLHTFGIYVLKKEYWYIYSIEVSYFNKINSKNEYVTVSIHVFITMYSTGVNFLNMFHELYMYHKIYSANINIIICKYTFVGLLYLGSYQYFYCTQK